MNTCQKKFTIIFFGAIIIVALIMTVPFFKHGIPNNDDSLIHFAFAESVYDSVSQGNILVKGEPKVNNGYGGYALRFYPNFTHYSLALAYFFTNDWHSAGFLFFWFWMAVGGFGMFYLAREWLDEKYAFVAALLYLLEPYHNAQTHLLFANAGFVATCLLTFCFLFVTRIIKHGKMIDIVVLAAFYGLLILTHIPLTLIGTIGLFIYGFLHLIITKNLKIGGLKLLAGFTAGIFAASFQLVRLFSELDWINHSASQFLTTGGFSYKNFFVDIRSIFFPNDLVLLNFLILLIPPAVLILLKSDKEAKKNLYPILTVTAFSIFISTSYSDFVWQAFPILQNIQFPWRWFSISSIGYAVIIAASIPTLFKLLDGKKLVPTIWTCCFVIAGGYFSITTIIGANLIDPEHFLLKNEAFNREVAKKSASNHLEFWQTIWTDKSAFHIKEKISASERIFEITSWDDFSKEVKVFEGKETLVRFSISYYPHWQAKVNGENVDVQKSDNGVILVPVPPEESVIQLEFVEPFLVKVFILFSILTWLTFLAAAIFNLLGKLKSQPLQDQI